MKAVKEFAALIIGIALAGGVFYLGTVLHIW